MKVACGTDIIEISRIKKSILHSGQKFLNKVYTAKEIEYCESRNNAKYQHYAARFASKEAVFKALNSIIEDKFSVSWQNIEILNDSKGRPYINLINIKLPAIINIDISISHCREYAVASVIMVYG